MVRTTEIRIAPEISGRVARFLVEPGQAVQRGQPVAVLNNPELWAAVGVARAEVDKARSDRDRVYAGVRDEQVQALQREIEKAQAVHAQAVQELARKSDSGHAIGCVGAGAGYRNGRGGARPCRYRRRRGAICEAQRGPTAEERALADATVSLAEAARDVVEARAAKMLLRAPASGTIAILAAEVGEAVVPGAPVLTMVPETAHGSGSTCAKTHCAASQSGPLFRSARRRRRTRSARRSSRCEIGVSSRRGERPARAAIMTSTRFSSGSTR